MMHHHLPVACEGSGEIFAVSRICAFFSRAYAREAAGGVYVIFCPRRAQRRNLGHYFARQFVAAFRGEGGETCCDSLKRGMKRPFS